MASALVVISIISFILAILIAVASAISHYKFSADISLDQQYYNNKVDNMDSIENPCDVTDPFDKNMTNFTTYEIISSAGLFLSIALALVGIITLANHHVRQASTVTTPATPSITTTPSPQAVANTPS